MPSGYVKCRSGASNKAGTHTLCNFTLGALITVFKAPADGSGGPDVGCGLAPAPPKFDADEARKSRDSFFERPISKTIGFPLLFRSCEGWGDEDIPNPYSEVLFLDIDADSSSFAKPTYRPKETAMVLRQDLKPFSIPQAQAVLNFCIMVMRRFEMLAKQAANPQAMGKVKKAIAAKCLNPQAFKEYLRT